ncbi:MAG: hypothetical protein KatS3mg105_5151 [Gemmatales bacterium]|nr:MAG: hypothetical protein KatS3mg105_5151 [Gemmatales bacterium]GIW97838.1 MAG: hypothetical protein KatS3mg111_1171 [Pirellulaceae bacterium]
MIWRSAEDADTLGAMVDLEVGPGTIGSLRLGKPGILLGIVGDPNCGKSVLSRLLDTYRAIRRERGWLLDCDAAAPTPRWYFDPRHPEVADVLRQEAKDALDG